MAAGPYQYLLYKGGINGTAPNNWYLRSLCMMRQVIWSLFTVKKCLYSGLSFHSIDYDRAIIDTFHRRYGEEELDSMYPKVRGII